MNNNDAKPNIVGFLCTWCAYTGADLAGVARMRIPASLRVVRVMCSGRIDPLFVIKAYLKGADGVMMMGCHPGNCHYQKGNYNARRRFIMLKSIFESLALEPDRLGLWWVSASEGPRYSKVTQEFSEKIEELGTSPLRDEIFL
ncbi:hydrogenase iron-sulfur subunit [Acidobacteriota bacterium]